MSAVGSGLWLAYQGWPRRQRNRRYNFCGGSNVFDRGLLGCDAMWSCRWSSTFPRNLRRLNLEENPKIEAIRLSETMVTYTTIRCHNPEAHCRHLRCENIESRMMTLKCCFVTEISDTSKSTETIVSSYVWITYDRKHIPNSFIVLEYFI
jgi:hypothetical protein